MATSRAPSSTLGVQPARTPRPQGVDDELAAHARQRLLAGPVDLRHAGAVSSGQRRPELEREMPRAGVEVRLEEHEHASLSPLAGRRQQRRDLARMMGVVVDDRHAAALADELEPARRAAEVRQHALRVRARNARQLQRRNRRRRVPPVVLARNRELERRPARAPSHAPRAAVRRASARTASATSASEANVEWWSRSTFVTTPISGRSCSSVRSDSSPSTTSHPSPAPALPPSCGNSPPTSQAGSSPSSTERIGDHRRRRRLPVRASDDDRAAQRDELGEELRPRRPRERTGTRSRRPSPILPERPAPRRSPPRRPRAPRRYGVSTRSQPPTSAPQARARNAYAESPAPPIPTNQSRRPSRTGKRDQLLCDLVGGVRPRHPQHRRAHRDQTPAIGEQLLDERRHAVELGLGHEHRAAAALEVPRVQRLMVGGRVRIGDEDRRRTGGGELPDRPAGARDREVRRGQCRPELVRRGTST